MSFYGSVYYQVINNFYKAIANNTGKNKKVFLNSDNFANNAAFEAIGRKGTLDFDTGNKWINLEKGSNQALNIYHAPASINSNNKTIIGFKKIEESEDQPNERDIIKLEPGDLIRTNIANYDEAGHVAGTTEQVYEMPLGESERIAALEKVVGNVVNGEAVDIDDLILPEIDDENKENLLGYVEDNTKNVNTLNSYVGNWATTMDGWVNRGYSTDFKPSVSEVIGDLDTLFKNGVSATTNNYKTKWNGSGADKKPTIANLIGDLAQMWQPSKEDPNTPGKGLGAAAEMPLAQAIVWVNDGFLDYRKSNDIWKNSTDGYITEVKSSQAEIRSDIEDLESNLQSETQRAKTAEAKVLEDAKAYTNEVKKGLLGEGISDTFDTLVEIQNWINGEGVNATELTEAIAIESKAREDADKQEVSDRNAAIEDAVKAEVTDRNTAINGAIAIEIGERNTAIANAVETEVTARNSAISNAIATEIGERNIAITNAKDSAIASANEYTDQQINNLSTVYIANTEILNMQIFDDDNIKNLQNLLDKINNLELRLSALEPDPENPDPGSENPDPDPENPDPDPENPDPDPGSETE